MWPREGQVSIPKIPKNGERLRTEDYYTLSKSVFRKCIFLLSFSSLGQYSSLTTFFLRTVSTPLEVKCCLDSAGSISSYSSSSTAYFTPLLFVPLKDIFLEVISHLRVSRLISAALILRNMMFFAWIDRLER